MHQTLNPNIKVITINTWKCDGDYHNRMKVLQKQLKALAPDIIVCQECFKTEDKEIDTLGYLSENLKMNALFSPARLKERRLGSETSMSYSGLGILSKYPVKLLEVIDIPSSKEDGGRVAQFSQISIAPNFKVAVANIHLSFLKGAEELRIQQLDFVLKKLEKYKDANCRLIAGDFNCEIESEEIQSMISNFKTTDCYVAGSGTEPRSSRIDQHGFQLNRCVDHIFSLDAEIEHMVFSDSGIVLNKPDDETGLYASDHCGITTTLNINYANR